SPRHEKGLRRLEGSAGAEQLVHYLYTDRGRLRLHLYHHSGRVETERATAGDDVDPAVGAGRSFVADVPLSRQYRLDEVSESVACEPFADGDLDTVRGDLHDVDLGR